jgi:hypothetical protein
VRPEEIMELISCCTDLAGERPVRVIAGEPGSRLPTATETSPVEAQRQEPHVRREQADGPQQVNAEQASKVYQPKGVWEGRAGHDAAKATDSERTVPERELDLPGVLAAARLQRSMWNRRDPPRRSTSDEPVAISAEREARRSRAGVRGGRSTCEGVENTPEGRTPASVAPALQVSARAWS